MPVITVVVPTFRRPGLLVHTLTSIQAQTLQDYEVLVCDNGADIETEQLAASFGNDRIRYLPRERNLGMLRNVIDGFTRARGDMVMVLNDDDMLLPESLESLVEPFTRHPELGLSFGAVQFIDEAGAVMEPQTRALHHSSGRSRMTPGWINNGTEAVVRGAVQLTAAALRKDTVDWAGIPDEVATAYDMHLMLGAVEHGRPVYYTGTTTIRYRLHSGSDTSRQLGRQARGAAHALESALASGAHRDMSVLQDRLAQVCLDAGRDLLQRRDPGHGRRFLRRSLSLRPSLTAARLWCLSLLPSAVASRISLATAKHYRIRKK